jgi:ribosomal protein S18 acetylase RimI-like enzyme
MPRTDVSFRSLVNATDVDVLPASSTVVERDGYCVVRTPSNPTYYWGNYVLFREPPRAGDRDVWEQVFAREHGSDAERGSHHVALAWDVVDGELGEAEAELASAGYEIEMSLALVAGPSDLTRHPRAAGDVVVRRLDPAPGADAEAWAAVTELQVASREPGHEEEHYRAYNARWLADRRERFVAGDGGWYVAELDGEVIGSCGVVVTDGRGRFQAVDTAESHRRRGVASRLVVEVGRDPVARFGATRLVIVADADYHAAGLYESLGFVARERTPGACWWPGAPRAALHPTRGAATGEEPLSHA